MALFYLSTFLSLSLLLSLSQATPLMITVVNNCPYTIWPAIQPNAGHHILERGGFPLETLHHHSFPAPEYHWSGRLWARTGCSIKYNRFVCETGDCGHLECNGAGGSTPTSLAQFSLHHGHNDQSSYSVSLVDGFNLPMTITPHEGQGMCPVVGCRANLIASCPEPLHLRSPSGHVVACKSACEAFNTDEFCCRNHYNSPNTCRASQYSEIFKHACPATFTYAYDSPSLTHNCVAPRELKVIFCH